MDRRQFLSSLLCLPFVGVAGFEGERTKAVAPCTNIGKGLRWRWKSVMGGIPLLVRRTKKTPLVEGDLTYLTNGGSLSMSPNGGCVWLCVGTRGKDATIVPLADIEILSGCPQERTK